MQPSPKKSTNRTKIQQGLLGEKPLDFMQENMGRTSEKNLGGPSPGRRRAPSSMKKTHTRSYERIRPRENQLHLLSSHIKTCYSEDCGDCEGVT